MARKQKHFCLPLEYEAIYTRFNYWVDQRLDHVPSFLESLELMSRRPLVPSDKRLRTVPHQTRHSVDRRMRREQWVQNVSES